eukprot:gene2473-biopygen87
MMNRVPYGAWRAPAMLALHFVSTHDGRLLPPSLHLPGFIVRDSDGEEFFVHANMLCGQRLVKGEHVTFDIGATRDGRRAAYNVAGGRILDYRGPKDTLG